MGNILKNKNYLINHLLPGCGIAYFILFFGQNEEASSRLVYILVGCLSMILFWRIRNQTVAENIWQQKVRRISTCIFGSLVLLANYRMYINRPPAIRMFTIAALFYAAMVVGTVWLVSLDRLQTGQPAIRQSEPTRPVRLFMLCFLIMAVLNLFILFTCVYPGEICSDSLNQIKQIIYGNYSNHHPFYHTMLIRVFYQLGMSLFHEINAAIAVYNVFQILFMALIFAFVIMTLAQSGAPKLLTVLFYLWFLLMPSHLTFSFTMWKDSVYGAVICLFVTSLFRCICRTGNHLLLNRLLLFLSGVGFGILRSNGLPALFLFFLIFLFVMRKKERMLKALIAGIILLSVICKYPVLKALSVEQPDTVESFSIPLQQIARVAFEDEYFSGKEREVIESIIPIQRMKEEYHPDISDYIKNLIRSEGDQAYMKTHQLRFLLNWVSVVNRHPILSLRAWADQTMGYWNPCTGFRYWMKWNDGVVEEEGLHQTSRLHKLNEWFHQYMTAFTGGNVILDLHYNLGLHLWILLLMVTTSIYQKRRDWILAVPVLALIATLLIATPMCYEFRYAYSLYTCLPLLLWGIYPKAASTAKPAMETSVDTDKAEEI